MLLTAVRDYEPRVVNCTKLLTDQIDRTISEPLNISMWFNFFTFDIVGDLAFGNSFNMLRDGIKHKFLEEAHVSATLMGMFRRTLWLMPIFKGTPLLNNQWQSFQAWLRDTVENRRKVIILPGFRTPLISYRTNHLGRTYSHGFWRITNRSRTLLSRT